MPLTLWSSPCLSVEYWSSTLGRRALVHVDAGSPVDLRVVLFCDQQFAGGTVQRIAEAVAVEMGQQLASGPADLLIGKDHLVDAVIVPFVMRGHLIDPLGHAGVRIACPDRHRPFVVAGTLLRIPGRGVARAVVDQVE